MEWIIYENQDESGEMEETLESSESSEGLPNGETGGGSEPVEVLPSNDEEVEEVSEEFETTESIDYSDQLQQIMYNQEQIYSMLHACCIFLALTAGIIIIFEFFKGVTR